MGKAGRSSGGRSGSSRSERSRSSGGRSRTDNTRRSSGGRRERPERNRSRAGEPGRNAGDSRPRGPQGGMGGPGEAPPRGLRRLFYGEGGGCVGNCATYAVLTIIVLGVTFFLFLGMLTMTSEDDTSSASLYAREKLELDITYDGNCVIDELGWVEDSAELGNSLSVFYEQTGIQPYIYLRAFDESLTTEDEMLTFAEDWYEDHIDNEGTFLFVYYAGESDSDDGYMCYVCGSDITSVMDEDAIEVFWDNVDLYWDSGYDAEEMLLAIYEDTAEDIMSAAVISGSADSTGRVAAAFIAVILAAALLVVVNRLRGKSSY